MLILEVEESKMAGYTAPAYRWYCPLCDYNTGLPDMDKSYIEAQIVTHMMTEHNVRMDKLKIEVKRG